MEAVVQIYFNDSPQPEYNAQQVQQKDHNKTYQTLTTTVSLKNIYLLHTLKTKQFNKLLTEYVNEHENQCNEYIQIITNLCKLTYDENNQLQSQYVQDCITFCACRHKLIFENANLPERLYLSRIPVGINELKCYNRLNSLELVESKKQAFINIKISLLKTLQFNHIFQTETNNFYEYMYSMMDAMLNLLRDNEQLTDFMETCCDELDEMVDQIVQKEADLITLGVKLDKQLDIEEISERLKRVRVALDLSEEEPTLIAHTMTDAVKIKQIPVFQRLLFYFTYQLKPLFIVITAALIYDMLLEEAVLGKQEMIHQFSTIYTSIRQLAQTSLYNALQDYGMIALYNFIGRFNQTPKIYEFEDDINIQEYINEQLESFEFLEKIRLNINLQTVINNNQVLLKSNLDQKHIIQDYGYMLQNFLNLLNIQCGHYFVDYYFNIQLNYNDTSKGQSLDFNKQSQSHSDDQEALAKEKVTKEIKLYDPISMIFKLEEEKPPSTKQDDIDPQKDIKHDIVSLNIEDMIIIDQRYFYYHMVENLPVNYLVFNILQSQLHTILNIILRKSTNYQIFLMEKYDLTSIQQSIEQFLLYNDDIILLRRLLEATAKNSTTIIQKEELEELILYKAWYHYKQNDGVDFIGQTHLELFQCKHFQQTLDQIMIEATKITPQYQTSFYSFKILDIQQLIHAQAYQQLNYLKSNVRNVLVELQTRINNELIGMRRALYQGQHNPLYHNILAFIIEFIKPSARYLFNELCAMHENNQLQYFNYFGFDPVVDQDMMNIPIFENFLMLFKECNEYQSNTYDQDVLHKMFHDIDKFLANASHVIYKRIEIIMKINIVEIEEMLVNPQKFCAKYPVLVEDIELPELQFHLKKTEFQQVEQLISNILRMSKLEISVTPKPQNRLKDPKKKLQIDQKPQLPDKVLKLQRYEQPLQLYDKVKLRASTNFIGGVKVDGLAIFNEHRFILQSLLAIEQAMFLYKQQLGFNFQEFQINYISIFDLNRAISPFCEVIQNVISMRSAHDDFRLGKMKAYPSSEFLIYIERTASCVQALRKNIEKGFQIQDFFSNLIRRRIQLSGSKEHRIENLVIDYSSWKEYLLHVEDFIRTILAGASLMYVLQSEKLNVIQQKRIIDYFKIEENDSLGDISCQALFKQFEKDNKLFDKCIDIWFYAQIDHIAETQLQKIYELLQNVLIETVIHQPLKYHGKREIGMTALLNEAKGLNFNVEAYEAKYKNRDTISCESVPSLVLLPVYVDEVASETLNQIALFLNNSEYYGEQSLVLTNKIDQLFARLYLKLIEDTEERHGQSQYSVFIQQKARDLERLIQVVRMLAACVRRIPCLLMDCLLVYFNGNPVKLNEIQALNISLMPVMDRIQLLDCQGDWTALVNQHFQAIDKVCLIDLATDRAFCSAITNLSNKIQEIHSKLSLYSMDHLCKSLSAPFDEKTMSFNEDLQILSYNSYTLQNGKEIHVNKQLIPTVNNVPYPLTVFVPTSLQLKFAGPGVHKFAPHWNFLRFEVMQNIDQIICNDNNDLVALRSEQEILKFIKPVSGQQTFQYIFDEIAHQSGVSLINQIKTQIDIFYINIQEYKKLRQNVTIPIYFKDVVQKQIKFNDLPEYFKIFEEFFNNTTYIAQVAIINTYLANIYKNLYIKAISGNIIKDDFRYSYFVLNDLSVLVYTYQQMTTIHKKAIVTFIQQWQDIFGRSMGPFLSNNLNILRTSSPQFCYLMFDQMMMKLTITDHLQQFKFPTGFHWTGSATVMDTAPCFGPQYYQRLLNIIKALYNKKSVILMGMSVKQYSSTELLQVSHQLSRLLCRRYIFVFLSEYTFGENLIRIQASISAGYIVIIIGLQYLLLPQILELQKLASIVTNRIGQLNSLITLNSIESYMREYQQICAINSPIYGKTKIQAKQARIENFKDSGYMLFYLPGLNTIQTSFDFAFTQKQSEEKDKLSGFRINADQKGDDDNENNVFDQYQEFYFPDEKIISMLKNFQNREEICLETDQPQYMFAQITPEYANAFYQINTFLRELNNGIAKLTFYDIKIILQRVFDNKDDNCVAIMTLDYILRQSIDLYTKPDMHALCILITNYICTSFGLDKQKTNLLVKMADYFYGYVQKQTGLVSHNRHQQAAQQKALKQSGTSDAQQLQQNQDTYNFQFYYTKYIQRNWNAQLSQFLQLFTAIYQVPGEFIYDIMLIENLLKLKKPLLIINQNVQYFSAFISVLCAREQREPVKVYSQQQLLTNIRKSQTEKKLIIFQPPTLDILLQAMDKIYGLFLSTPVIQDMNGQPIHISSQHDVIPVIVALNIQQYIQFSTENKISEIFQNKVMLFPHLQDSHSLSEIFFKNFILDTRKYEGIEEVLHQSTTTTDTIMFQTDSYAIDELYRMYSDKMISTNMKLQYKQQVRMKLAQMASTTKTLLQKGFKVVQNVFDIGQSIEEIMLLRSIYNYNLSQFGVIRPCKRQIGNYFINICHNQLWDLFTNEGKRAEMIEKMQWNNQPALSFDNYTRYVGGLYQENKKKKKVASRLQTSLKSIRAQSRKGSAINNLNNQSDDKVQLAHDALTIERRKVSNSMETFDEQIGFIKSEMSEIEQKAREIHKTAPMFEVAKRIQQLTASKAVDYQGIGCQGSIFYQFESKFIQFGFLKPENIKQCSQNLVEPIIIALWNAASLWISLKFIQRQQLMGTMQDQQKRHKVLKQLNQLLEQKYTSFIGQLKSEFGLELPAYPKQQGHDIEPLKYISYFWQQNQDKTSRKYDQFETFKEFTEYKIGTVLLGSLTSESEADRVIRLQAEPAATMLRLRIAKLESDRQETIKNQEKLVKKQEDALFAQIDAQQPTGEDDEQAREEQNIIMQLNNDENPYYSIPSIPGTSTVPKVTNQVQQVDNSNEPNNIGNMPRVSEGMLAPNPRKLQQAQKQSNKSIDASNVDIQELVSKHAHSKQINIQRLQQDYLYLDAHRCAFVVLLASSMLTPLSISVAGKEKTGKSTLINIAKLLIRDQVKQFQVLLSEVSSEGSSTHVKQSICNNYLTRNYKISQKCRYNYNIPQLFTSLDDDIFMDDRKYLDYYIDIGYPSYHFNFSRVSIQSEHDLHPDFVILLRDHSICFDQLNTNEPVKVNVNNQFECLIGTAKLSDCSFIVECDVDNTYLQNLCDIQLIVPPLTEQYMSNLIVKQSNVSLKTSKQFIQGLIEVSHILPSSISNNYLIIEKINQHRKTLMQPFQSQAFNQLLHLISLYETEGLDMETQTKKPESHDLLTKNIDMQFDLFNIHSFIYALKALAQVDEQKLENINEQLASLCMLNKLQVNNNQTGQGEFDPTPWSDSQVIMQEGFNLYQSWYSFIISEGLANSKRTIKSNKQTQTTFNNLFSYIIQEKQYIYQIQPLFDKIISQNISDSALISLDSYQLNNFWFYHFVELYRLFGQKIRPHIACKVFEIMIHILSAQTKNKALINQIISFGTMQATKSALTNIQTADDMSNIREYVICQCVNQAAIINKEGFLPEDIQKLYDEDLKKESYKYDSNSFKGIPMILSYALTPIRLQINMQQQDEQQINEFITLLAEVLGYQKFGNKSRQYNPVSISLDGQTKAKQYQDARLIQEMIQNVYGQFQKQEDFFTTKNKYLFNIEEIYGRIISGNLLYDKFQLVEKLSQTYKYLLKYQETLGFTNDQIQFSIYFLIFRYIVLLTLGINPQLALFDFSELQSGQFQQLFGFKNTISMMQSFFPSKVVQSGYNLSQFPYTFSSQVDLNKRIKEYSQHEIKTVHHIISFNNRPNTQFQTIHNRDQTAEISLQLLRTMTDTMEQNELTSQFINQPISGLIVCKNSQLAIKCENGVVLGDLLTRIFNQNNILPSLFDQEEQLVITKLIASRLNQNVLISTQTLNTLLLTNLHVLTINDDVIAQPLNTFYDCGAVNLPLLQFLNNIYDKHKQLTEQALVQALKGKSKHGKTRLNIKIQIKNPYEIYIQKLLQKSVYNQIKITLRDTFALYKISGCTLPQEQQIPIIQEFSYDIFNNQFVFIATQLYKQLRRFVIAPCISMHQFTSMAASICNLVIKKCQEVFKQQCVTRALGVFYSNLSNIAHTKESFNLKIDQLTTDMVKQIMLTKVHDMQQKAKGQISDQIISNQNAIYESIILKETFQKMEEMMQQQYETYEYILRTAHINSIALAAYLAFGQVNNLDMRTVKENIYNGSFGELDIITQNILNQEKSDFYYNLFNIVVIVIIQSIGFNVVHPTMNMLKQNIQPLKTQIFKNQQIIISSQAQNYGKSMFISEIAETLSYDWPIYMILKALDNNWTPNDNQYNIISAILIEYHTGKTVFVVPENLGFASACALSSIIKPVNDNEENYFDYTMNCLNKEYTTSDENDNSENQQQDEYIGLVKQFMSNIYELDLYDKYTTQFANNLIDAIKQEKVIVINNFYAINNKNSQLVKFMLQQLLTEFNQGDEVEVTKKKIILGQEEIELQSQPIVLLSYSGQTTQSLVQNLFSYYNLLSQQIYDKLSIFIQYQSDQQFDDHQQLKYDQLILHQQLVSAIFLSEKLSARAISEQIKIERQKLYIYITKCNKQLKEYIKNYIFVNYDKEALNSYLKLDNMLITRLNQISLSPEQINKFLCIVSFINNQNPKQTDELNKVFGTLQQIHNSLVTQRALFNTEQPSTSQYYGTLQHLQQIEQYVTRTSVQHIVYEVSHALSTVIQLMKIYQKSFFPTIIMSSQSTYNKLIQKLQQEMATYRNDLLNKYENKIPEDIKLKRESGLDKDQFYFFEHFPLLYQVNKEHREFKVKVVGVVMPFVAETLYHIFPKKYAQVMWMISTTLFLQIIGLLDLQVDYENQSDGNNMKFPLDSFLSLQRNFVYNEDDQLRMAVTTTLRNCIDQRSIFSIDKLSQADIQIITDVMQTMPKICLISSKLQNLWLKLSLISRYNQQINQSLPWYILNHASFVGVSKSKNAFREILFYLQDPKQSRLDQIPPQLSSKTLITFYSAYLLSINNNNQILWQNNEEISKYLLNVYGKTPSEISTGLTKQYGNAMYARLNTEKCAKLTHDYYQILFQLFGITDYEPDSRFIGTILWQLLNIVNSVQLHQQNTKQKKKNSYIQMQTQNEQEPKKKIINQVFVLYYDDCINVELLLFFSLQILHKNYTLQQLPQDFTYADLLNSPGYIIANEQMQGTESLNNVVHQLNTAREIQINPIFILIPVQPLPQQKDPRDILLPRQIDDQFQVAVQKINEHFQSTVQIYLRIPEKPIERFAHICGISAAAVCKATWITKSRRLIRTASTYRGFACIILDQILTSIDDQKTSMTISSLMQASMIQGNMFDKLSIRHGAPVIASSFADSGIFDQGSPSGAYTLISHELLYKRRQMQCEEAMIELLFGRKSQINRFKPNKLCFSEAEDFTIDQKIKAKMNVAEKDLNDSNEGSDVSGESMISMMNGNVEESDFDDSMSMFSASSRMTGASQMTGVSAATGATALTQGTQLSVAGAMNVGRKHKAQEEDSPYQTLLTGLLITTAGRSVDLDGLEKTVGQKLFNKSRKCKIIENGAVSIYDLAMEDQNDDRVLEDGGNDPSKANSNKNAARSQPGLPHPPTVISSPEASGQQADPFTLRSNEVVVSSQDVLSESSQQKSQKTQHFSLWLPENSSFAEFQSFYDRIANEVWNEESDLCTVRRVFNGPQVHQLLRQLRSSGPGPSAFGSPPSDALGAFLGALRCKQSIDQYRDSFEGPQLTPSELAEGLLRTQTSQESNCVLGRRVFGTFQGHCVIAAAFAPALGDLFNFMRMQAASQTNAPLHRQRIIVTVDKPTHRPVIGNDGSIDVGGGAKHYKASDAPFYVQLRGFELYGLCYDRTARTVVDGSTESRQGFCQSFDLYAVVATVESWQAAGSYMAELQTPSLKVCDAFVPVPLLVGGYVRPVVLLPNTTKHISSAEFASRGAFFAPARM